MVKRISVTAAAFAIIIIAITLGSKAVIAQDKKTPLTSVESQSVANRKLAFRKTVERVLLKNGYSVDVFIEKNALIIYMPLNKAMVYAAVTEGKMLQQARDAGFSKLVFQSTGSAGAWTFNLTRGIPSCDVMLRICI